MSHTLKATLATMAISFTGFAVSAAPALAWTWEASGTVTQSQWSETPAGMATSVNMSQTGTVEIAGPFGGKVKSSGSQQLSATSTPVVMAGGGGGDPGQSQTIKASMKASGPSHFYFPASSCWSWWSCGGGPNISTDVRVNVMVRTLFGGWW